MQVPSTITTVNTIAERLLRAREQKRWSQDRLASEAGVSQGTIGNIEAGLRKNPRELLAIAKALDVRAEWLKDGDEPMRNEVDEINFVEQFLPELIVNSERQSEFTPFTGYKHSGKKLILAPVVAWASLGIDLQKDNKDVFTTRYEAVPLGSKPSTKWVEIDADMPRLMLSRGDLILITPISGQHECKESKMHLFRTIGGAYFLGTFRQLALGFEAIPDSGPALESVKHGVQVVGIKHGHIEAM